MCLVHAGCATQFAERLDQAHVDAAPRASLELNSEIRRFSFRRVGRPSRDAAGQRWSCWTAQRASLEPMRDPEPFDRGLFEAVCGSSVHAPVVLGQTLGNGVLIGSRDGEVVPLPAEGALDTMSKSRSNVSPRLGSASIGMCQTSRSLKSGAMEWTRQDGSCVARDRPSYRLASAVLIAASWSDATT